MSIVLVLHFTDRRELVFDKYTTLDINRSSINDIHINATNTNEDLQFNGVFEEIAGLLGDDKCFSVTIKREKGQATFDGMAVDYYLNAGAEVLHFGRRVQQSEIVAK